MTIEATAATTHLIKRDGSVRATVPSNSGASRRDGIRRFSSGG